MWVVLRSFLAGIVLMGLAFTGLYEVSARYTPTPWERFYNAYVSFNLPPGWSCKVAGTEFVCRSAHTEEARRSIVVLTAKFIGPNDNFDYYTKYLETPKAPESRDGTPAPPSRVISLERRMIGDIEWMVGVHHGSLLPNFVSEYYVTTYKDVSVLLTYSFRIGEPARIAGIGERIAESLAIVL